MTDKRSKNKGIVLSVTVFAVLLPVFTAVWLLYGPFETVRRTWICTAMSTANHKYLATALFSDQTIERYTSDYFNSIDALPSQNDGLIDISDTSEDITVEEVSIGLAKGRLMRIPDPSRIDIAVCDYIGNSGMTLESLIVQENALGGINAGAYVQKDGSPHGSIPGGIIIKDGKTVYFEENRESDFCIIGFRRDNILTVCYAETAEEAESLGLRCAVSFGPPLIINGEPLIEQSGTSLQPRTAIAQCADGSVLFLVLDGRQASSAGATLKNVQDLLLQYGAVTAANLDGGSSSAMIYENELLNSPSDGGELKLIPTAFIIKE